MLDHLPNVNLCVTLEEFPFAIDEMEQLAAELRKIFTPAPAWREGYVLSCNDKTVLMKKHGFSDERKLMVAAASALHDLAHPPISGYEVSIVGKERETGDLIFGGNLEFEGAPLSSTVHAEQFLFSRAYHRGHSIESFALQDPTPCGHCRQFILEFQDGKNVRVQNAKGLEFRVGDLLPFSFGPEQLKAKGIRPGQSLHKLSVGGKKKYDDMTGAALAAANQSYCPYSATPAGVALQTKNQIVPGSYIENAAFNPSLPPLQAALINLTGFGLKPAQIQAAVLVQAEGKVDHGPETRALLSVIAPKVELVILPAK